MAASKRAPKETSRSPEREAHRARLVILDSHAILHRAYHALPDFTSSRGEPTGALYGLILMLLKIRDDLKPDYIVAARDLPGQTHRHQVFEAYKATRAKTEDALIEQLKRAPNVLEAFGVPVYSAPGFEADDVLGTIVKQLGGRKDIDIIIASGDMDTLQLVRDGVRVFTLRKGLSDTVLYDAEAVQERYGFGPEHIVDYKALCGDPSDNIPGVRGIGEKTATELIKQFGSVEEIYEALANGAGALEERGVKARTIQLLLDGKSDAQFSKGLATIHADVPISFELPGRMWHLEDSAASIAATLDELEFRALKERLRGVIGSKGDAAAPGAADADGIDPVALEETSIALWLLRSDLTTPSLDDILNYARTEDFERARETIFAALRDTGRLSGVFESIERPLMPVVHRMNETGIVLDASYLHGLETEYAAELASIAARIYGYAGHAFNINSPKQLGDVLYDELGITPAKQKKTATGARTTREEELQKMAELHPVIGEVLAYRELQKLLSTYIEKMPKLIADDGRLHTRFQQSGTTTGRMSCQDPNLQNIPVKTESGKRIRNAFKPDDGFTIIAIDYSQIELRIAAGLSADEKLAEVFRSGGDVHAAVASHVFAVPPDLVDHEMRRRAKVINFGILYGMGVNALRANLGEGVSRAEAQQFMDDYFRNFAGLARYIEHTKADAARLGYTETLYGRRRYFPGFSSPLPGLRAQAERMAINAPIQGTQADIIKRAMVETDALIEGEGWRGDARLLLQVHDELVYEIRAERALEIGGALRTVMEDVVDPAQLAGVPIRAEMSAGPSWGETVKVPRS